MISPFHPPAIQFLETEFYFILKFIRLAEERTKSMRLSQNLNYFSSRYSGYFTLSKTLAESELSIAAVNVHDSYGNTNSEKYPSV